MGNELIILLNKVLPPAPYTPTREGIEALRNSIVNPVVEKCGCGNEVAFYDALCFTCYYDKKTK
jgi:hypothetical protein